MASDFLRSHPTGRKKCSSVSTFVGTARKTYLWPLIAIRAAAISPTGVLALDVGGDQEQVMVGVTGADRLAPARFKTCSEWCPRQDLNLCPWLRRPVLYPG